MSSTKEFTKGLWVENPVFVTVLAICPTMATSTSVTNAFCMGAAATLVAVGSNVIISLFRNVIPGEIRIPCYIVIIASFVTMIDLAMHAFLPLEIYETMGIFIPLIVVNCIMLGRAEAYASRNGVWASFLDGLGMGLGFSLALFLLSIPREFLGNGTLLNYQITSYFASKSTNPNAWIEPISVLGQPAGGFLIIGLYLAFFTYLRHRKQEKEIEKAKAK
jgi:electron transport complex protein RnfE